jgi:Family of unknown function (DUF5367)
MDRDVDMEKRDIIQLTAAGLLIWFIGTIYYAYVGPNVLETSGIRYWTSFALSPILSAWLCIVIMRRSRIAPANWVTAMLLLAIPGMIGEAVVLANMTTFMPRLHAESAGRYGALLFATYAFVLGIAAVVTLRAARQAA